MSLRCAVFASGGGSNFQKLLDRQESGDLHVEFSVLIGNNSTAAVFERARKKGIPTVHLPPSKFSCEEEYIRELEALLLYHKIELIILAGYMRKLPARIVHTYTNRIINVHPGLLPAFGGQGMYGIRVHQAVIDYGAKVSGVTVHFVDEEYDHGPILLQESLKVLDSDDAESLAERVLELEHAVFWKAIEAIAAAQVRIVGRRVFIDE